MLLQGASAALSRVCGYLVRHPAWRKVDETHGLSASLHGAVAACAGLLKLRKPQHRAKQLRYG